MEQTMHQAAAGKSTAETDPGTAILQKARELRPLFSSQAEAGEAKGALTDETIAAIEDAGFLGAWIPETYGGSEIGPVPFLELIEELSYADGSTGWVVMALQVATATAAAYLDRPVADQLFSGRHARIAGQGAPNGRAVPVEGGYRLTGNWSYGSGLLHSDYIHTGGLVFEGDKPRIVPGTNAPDSRIFIVPVSDAELKGNWDVMGLRATGSVDYSITDVFVPEEFTHSQSAKRAKQGRGLYRLGIQGLGAICHSGFALGNARRMLDELAAIARAESGRPSFMAQPGGGEAFQEHFAQAEAKLRAARAFVVEAQSDIQRTTERDEPIATRQYTLSRLSLNIVTSAAAEVCTFAYKYGGGIALRSGTLQRCFRDMYAGTQHVTTGPNILRECGKELLGLTAGKVWGPRGLIDPLDIANP